MYILLDNKLKYVSLDEDDTKDKIIAIKSVEELLKEPYTYPESTVKDKIFTLGYELPKETGSKQGYLFRITQSQYKDDSGLKGGMGVCDKKGEAILKALRNGYKVFNGDIEITLPKGVE